MRWVSRVLCKAHTFTLITLTKIVHCQYTSEGILWYQIKVSVLCCLMTPGLSKDIQCHVWPYFSKLANHQIKHQVTQKVGCQPGDCIWSLYSSSGVCVGMYGLTHSLYHLQGVYSLQQLYWNYGMSTRWSHFSLKIFRERLSHFWLIICIWRDDTLAIMMTAADLSIMLKPWHIHKEVTHALYEEFWNQGDFELLLGKEPINMMDRNKKDDLPENQVIISSRIYSITHVN